jgi:L-lactate dehydrogenase complex protein LldG
MSEPPVGGDGALVARFAAELTAVAGTPHPGVADPAAAVVGLLGPAPTLVAVDDDPDLEPVAAALVAAGHDVIRPHQADYRDRLAVATAGVTRCAAAIADTGSLLLVFDQAHPRSTSLLPRTHVAVVRPGDLVPSLGDALTRLPSPLPSAATCVTGPSRSADIEQVLTLGVHGPAQVHVVLP